MHPMKRDLLKRYLCIIVVSFASIIVANAQKMSIASIEYAERDLTALTRNLEDQNGEKCALIKIETTERNFLFDVGSLGIILKEDQNEEHPSEIWLFVPNGVKSITIQHPQLGTIRDYDLGESLKKAKTYILKLTTDRVSTLVVDYTKSQKLQLCVTPKTSKVYINGMPQTVDANGLVNLTLPLGVMTYRIEAPRYHSTENKIVLDKADSTLKINVNLKQAFGYLNIVSDKTSENADIYVDSVKVGIAPVSALSINSGKHRLFIKKKLYAPYIEEINIKDSVSYIVKPILTPNNAEVSVTVTKDKDATIYLDGEQLGQGLWNGLVEVGKHTIECKKPSHTTTTKSIIVEKDHKLTIAMDAPSPIYGMLKITTEPQDVTVLIDDKIAGKTPYTNNMLLIGQHHIELQKPGYKPETTDVNITEAKLETINMKLTDYCVATITAEPFWANIYVNSDLYNSPHKLDVYAGKYNIRVSANGYVPYSKVHDLDANTKDFTIKLKKKYIYSDRFYFTVGYNPVGLQAATAGMGFYYHNFNFEASYAYGMAQSETIYWNYTGDSEYSMLPDETTYKAMAFGAKIGYGLSVSNRFRLTPQVGAMLVKLSDYNHARYYDGTTAISVTFGLKCSYYITRAFGLSFTPEYHSAVNKGVGYSTLAELSSTIKNNVDGVGCNVALFLCF
jgi:hypothetical protein